MKHLIVTLTAAAILLVACGTDTDTGNDRGEPITSSGNTENPPADDVTLDVCGPDDATGWAKASGTILNHSSEASTYFIQVEFVDAAGVRYSESITSSAAVAPDQTVEWEAPAVDDYRDGTVCRLTTVDRYAS